MSDTLPALLASLLVQAQLSGVQQSIEFLADSSQLPGLKEPQQRALLDASAVLMALHHGMKTAAVKRGDLPG
jgi:hypothetical protein